MGSKVVIEFTGKEFKQFWADDEYWEHGSLYPKELSVSADGIKISEYDIDDVARGDMKDESKVVVLSGIIKDRDTKEIKSAETFCFEWLEGFQSVKYTLSFKQNSVLEKFLEFCFKRQGVEFEKEYGDKRYEIN